MGPKACFVDGRFHALYQFADDEYFSEKEYKSVDEETEDPHRKR